MSEPDKDTLSVATDGTIPREDLGSALESENRKKAEEWIKEHLTGPNVDPNQPGTGWPEGVRILTALLDSVQAQGDAEGYARGRKEDDDLKMVDFRLPDGRIVGIHADVARFHNFLTYQLSGGKIVIAWRVVRI